MHRVAHIRKGHGERCSWHDVAKRLDAIPRVGARAAGFKREEKGRHRRERVAGLHVLTRVSAGAPVDVAPAAQAVFGQLLSRQWAPVSTRAVRWERGIPCVAVAATICPWKIDDSVHALCEADRHNAHIAWITLKNPVALVDARTVHGACRLRVDAGTKSQHHGESHQRGKGRGEPLKRHRSEDHSLREPTLLQRS